MSSSAADDLIGDGSHRCKWRWDCIFNFLV